MPLFGFLLACAFSAALRGASGAADQLTKKTKHDGGRCRGEAGGVQRFPQGSSASPHARESAKPFPHPRLVFYLNTHYTK